MFQRLPEILGGREPYTALITIPQIVDLSTVNPGTMLGNVGTEKKVDLFFSIITFIVAKWFMHFLWGVLISM